jgi:hypothetical protein
MFAELPGFPEEQNGFITGNSLQFANSLSNSCPDAAPEMPNNCIGMQDSIQKFVFGAVRC